MAVVKNTKEIADTLRLGPREIARRVGLSHSTVSSILNHDKRSFYSDDSKKKVEKEVVTEAQKVMKNLERLMGPAAH